MWTFYRPYSPLELILPRLPRLPGMPRMPEFIKHNITISMRSEKSDFQFEEVSLSQPVEY